MSSLGSMGRFGNQLFQYCHAKALARQLNTNLQIPADWIGRKIFKIPEEPILINLPNSNKNQDNVNLYGYFQSSPLLYTKSDVKQWLQFREDLNIDQYYPRYVFHVRQFNDTERYASIKPIAYHKFIAKEFDGRDFYRVGKWKVRNNIVDPGEFTKQTDIDFLGDFLILMNAKILVRANSTFSFWAGLLGEIHNDTEVYSPKVEDQIGDLSEVEFVKGNHCKMASEKYHNTRLTDIFIKD